MRAIDQIDNGLIFSNEQNQVFCKVERRNDELVPQEQLFVPCQKKGTALTGTKDGVRVMLNVDPDALRQYQEDVNAGVENAHRRIVGQGVISSDDDSISVNLFPASKGFIGIKPSIGGTAKGVTDLFV